MEIESENTDENPDQGRVVKVVPIRLDGVSEVIYLVVPEINEVGNEQADDRENGYPQGNRVLTDIVYRHESLRRP